ncbi:MAG: hypothetical protein RQ741_08830 [Wenzhouxiangellaceae bacterium]|nr:hypothetical protein [Wenzhouxiangellaceae bacterium]
MSDAMVFYIAIFVFSMMVIGLVLTILEFRFGEPKDQAEEDEAQTRQSTSGRRR